MKPKGDPYRDYCPFRWGLSGVPSCFFGKDVAFVEFKVHDLGVGADLQSL